MPDMTDGHITYWERLHCGKYRKRRLELRICRDPAICAEGIGLAVWADNRYLYEAPLNDAVGLAFSAKGS